MCFIYVHEKITMVTTVCVFDVVNGCEWGMLNIQCYGWYVQKTWPSYWCIGWLILCLMLKILLSLLLFEAKNNKPQESSIFDRKNLGFHKKRCFLQPNHPEQKKTWQTWYSRCGFRCGSPGAVRCERARYSDRYDGLASEVQMDHPRNFRLPL